MSQGPENRLISSIHKRLPATTYYEKMHNPYRGGTPDVWYSGKGGDLWVEYKWKPTMPVKGKVVPALSKLQELWLRARWEEGRRVFVAVGCSDGVFVYRNPTAWEQGIPARTFRVLLMSKTDYATWLVNMTTGDGPDAENSRKTRPKRKGVDISV